MADAIKRLWQISASMFFLLSGFVISSPYPTLEKFLDHCLKYGCFVNQLPQKFLSEEWN